MQPSFTITGPESIVAALPHLLGFAPTRSLIIVWVGQAHVVLTQRVDLPGAQVPAREFGLWLANAGSHADADQAVVIVVDDEGRESHWGELVESVADALEDTGVEVLDRLRVVDDRYWSYGCTPPCCPADGRAVSADVAGFIAACFPGPPAAARGALVAEFARDPVGCAAVAAEVAGLGDIAAGEMEAWRDAHIEAALRLFAAEPAQPSSGEWADVLLGLMDIRVRDTVAWSIGQEDSPPVDVLSDGVRRAPNGLVAPIATLLALACWQIGDGARAMIALDRALADDAEYGLAQMVAQAIGSGLPPRSWRQVLDTMSREICRRGLDPDRRVVDRSV